jgi:hypothetical protein
MELSGLGRMMADGTNEDEARAERMDGWIVWETEERESHVGGGGQSDNLSFLFYFLLSGTHTPMRAEDFFCYSEQTARSPLRFPWCVRSTYPLGMNGPYQKREPNK